MKKKGLIISTVVMVVVLIASLTTATYAWFTTTDVTTVSGFELSVAASTSVNIGLKANCTYESNATADSFVSGDCHYAPTVENDGSFAGTWTGETPTMSPTINHNINWGLVDKAVGVSNASSVAEAQYDDMLTFAERKTGGIMVAANLKAGKTFKDKTAAVANGDKAPTSGDAKKGDYAYLFLGVSPSKTLQADTNYVYVIVQAAGNGSTLGIASAIHVAYRLNSAQEWTDTDVFGKKHYNDGRSGCTAEVKFDASAVTNLGAPTVASDKSKTTFNNAAVVPIKLTQTEINKIDQLELMIYLAGSDSDCIDAAKGVSVNVAIYLSAQSTQD